METFSDALTISAIGISVVFVVLAVIATLVALIGLADARWTASEAEQKVAALDKTPTIDDTTLILISAAVAVALQGRGRIRRIRRLQPMDATASPWSQKARASLHGSHVVRHQREKI